MDPTEFARQYEPFIAATVRRWGIPGCDDDDKRGEIYHVLVKCVRGYDPASGVPFFFYFRSAVANHLGKVLTRGLVRRGLLAEYSSLFLCGMGELYDDDPGLRQIPDPSPGPDRLAESAEFMDRLNRLSPVARAYISWRTLGQHCEQRTPVDIRLTAAQRRAARAELKQELAEELREWRNGLRIPVGRDGKPVRNATSAARWVRAEQIT
jgi:hypothetical protein